MYYFLKELTTLMKEDVLINNPHISQSNMKDKDLSISLLFSKTYYYL